VAWIPGSSAGEPVPARVHFLSSYSSRILNYCISRLGLCCGVLNWLPEIQWSRCYYYSLERTREVFNTNYTCSG